MSLIINRVPLLLLQSGLLSPLPARQPCIENLIGSGHRRSRRMIYDGGIKNEKTDEWKGGPITDESPNRDMCGLWTLHEIPDQREG